MSGIKNILSVAVDSLDTKPNIFASEITGYHKLITGVMPVVIA